LNVFKKVKEKRTHTDKKQVTLILAKTGKFPVSAFVQIALSDPLYNSEGVK